DRAETLVFVKDGFSWAAALFAPLWLIVHRLWWPLLGYAVVTGAMQLPQLLFALDQRWLGLTLFALHLLIGFEADTLRRWRLEQRGWHTIGTVSGRTPAECERRFFDAWLPAQPILATSTQPPTPGGGWRLLGARS